MNLKEKIVEVLYKHQVSIDTECNTYNVVNASDYESAATEIAALVNEDVVKEIDSMMLHLINVRNLPANKTAWERADCAIYFLNRVKDLLTSKQ